MNNSKATILASLRKELLALNGIRPSLQEQQLPEGLAALKPHLPLGQFPTGAIHEFLCPQPEDGAVSGAFVSGLISACIHANPLLVWISAGKTIFPPTLLHFNIAPHQVVFIHPANEKELLWVLEEALRCEQITAVVAEISRCNFTASRRLQLAVEKSRVTGFIFNQQLQPAAGLSFVSRWQVSALPSEAKGKMPGVGFPRWRVNLLKMRNGKAGSWNISWRNNCFTVAGSSPAALHPFVQQKKTG